MRNTTLSVILILILAGLRTAGAHEAHHQPPTSPDPGGDQEASLFTRISEASQDIRPILKEKCFDCHSTATRFPWYYRLPVARQIIDDDIREAREHLDLSGPFPFKGHHKPREQLDQIRKVVEKNKMPLWRYRLLHPGSGLTPEEKEVILRWADESRRLLNK